MLDDNSFTNMKSNDHCQHTFDIVSHDSQIITILDKFILRLWNFSYKLTRVIVSKLLLAIYTKSRKKRRSNSGAQTKDGMLTKFKRGYETSAKRKRESE